MRPETLRELDRIWRSLRRRDTFPFVLGRAALAMSGVRPSLFSPARLLQLVQANLGFRDIAQAAIELVRGHHISSCRDGGLAFTAGLSEGQTGITRADDLGQGRLAA